MIVLTFHKATMNHFRPLPTFCGDLAVLVVQGNLNHAEFVQIVGAQKSELDLSTEINQSAGQDMMNARVNFNV